MRAPYPAKLYSLVHRGTPGDVPFYREACADAGAILELGCGYGRILEALAMPDRLLIGLDRDPGLGPGDAVGPCVPWPGRDL